MNAVLARTNARGALTRCGLAAALTLALSGGVPAAAAAEGSLRQRLQADPRTAHAATMTLAERRAFAHDYGLENLLPRTEGATVAVTNCNDAGSGSLRAAVAAAASGDTVDARALSCSTISLATGAIAITVDDLSILGPGPDALQIGNGAKYGRVFRHTGTGALTISGLTINHGTVSPSATESGTQGGCIYSTGAVNLGNPASPEDRDQGVVVTGCTAISTQANVRAQGGAVFAQRGLSLSASRVSGCSAIAQDSATRAHGGGVTLSPSAANVPFAAKYSEVRDNKANGSISSSGGIDAPFASSVLVVNSTISGNSAQSRAGGAYLGTNSGQPVEIENSTISGNTSDDGEAGMVVNVASGPVPGSIRIASTTITQNRSGNANAAGGAFLTGGPIELQSTIASGNLAGGSPKDLTMSVGASGADNLVGVENGAPSSGLIVSNDAGLAPLADNGGLTRTHALLPGSLAVDSGNNAAATSTDQRGAGFARTIGARADIGAFERDPDVIFRNGFQ